jgi:hypothetical protein
MVSDKPFHVLRLVTGCVVYEEYDLPRPRVSCMLEEVGEVELVLPAPPLRSIAVSTFRKSYRKERFLSCFG